MYRTLAVISHIMQCNVEVHHLVIQQIFNLLPNMPGPVLGFGDRNQSSVVSALYSLVRKTDIKLVTTL